MKIVFERGESSVSSPGRAYVHAKFSGNHSRGGEGGEGGDSGTLVFCVRVNVPGTIK